MTSPNVELVRRIYADWERGDYSSADWAHPDIEFVMGDGPTPGSWTGIAAMGPAWAEALAPWEELRAEAEECRDLDGERVLVLTRNTGRGKTSGLELGDMGTRGANVFHIRDGRVIRLAVYFSRDLALADLDLGGQAP